jgi:hypothetical protein
MRKELKELKEWVQEMKAKYFVTLPLYDWIPYHEARDSYQYYMGLFDGMNMVLNKINEIEEMRKYKIKRREAANGK